LRPSRRSGGVAALRREFVEVVIDGDAEIRFALEGRANVAHAMGLAIEKFDDGENEIVGLVERITNLVFGDGLTETFLNQ
jgi:hypothetical protein